jgi:hypothetical protein
MAGLLNARSQQHDLEAGNLRETSGSRPQEKRHRKEGLKAREAASGLGDAVIIYAYNHSIPRPIQTWFLTPC